MSDRLRVGLLGCGSFAHRHAQNLRMLSDEVIMVAFCNRTIDKAAAFAELYGVGETAVSRQNKLHQLNPSGS